MTDLESVLERLAGGGEKQSDLDLHRDFKQVFSTDQGRRVFYTILKWGHLLGDPAALANFDTNKTMFLNGETNLALRILNAVLVEPKERPTKAVSVKPAER